MMKIGCADSGPPRLMPADLGDGACAGGFSLRGPNQIPRYLVPAPVRSVG